MKRFIKQISIVAAMAIWAGSVSAADDAPGEEDIARAIGLWLPSYLSIEKIDILATVNDGDAINPRFRQRFVAETIPRENLYSVPTQYSDLKPYIMLVETRTPQQPHKLYGVASSALVLGKWNLELRMENGIDGLGQPVAMYSRPAIIIGSEDAERAIENLNAIKTLNKTLAELAIRVEADATMLQAAADEELELLRNENRKRLGAIVDRYEQERAGIKASQETLTAIAEAEAEIASLDILTATQKELSRKRKLAREQQKKMLEEEINEVSAQRDALLEAIRSEDADKRRTGFDAMFASSEEQLNTMALKEAFASADQDLKAHAIEIAMDSGVENLQEMALKAWITGLPTIMLAVYDRDGRDFQGTMVYEAMVVDQDHRLTGKLHLQDVKWFQRGGYSVSKRIDGTGLVHQNRISLQGVFTKPSDGIERYCKGDLNPSEKAFLAGFIDCNYNQTSQWYRFFVVVDS